MKTKKLIKRLRQCQQAVALSDASSLIGEALAEIERIHEFNKAARRAKPELTGKQEVEE